ncbi:conjugal transfer protein [Miniphocaeibacter massiliensis]|uniref:conjugal transfer protein n=1 Tax=Miniphocaeibacter massiliensis TaxID=2041841 RepID=UPI000C06BDA5|nr:conjugal transfer protein [Miniphocaeibacter massiliensis]
MCTRFVYNGDDLITGFNFEIDLDDYTHKIIKEKDIFYIGIKMPDGLYHSYHGVNINGNVGTLLYVHGNENAKYSNCENCVTIADLVEKFIKNEISFDDAVKIVDTQKIVYYKESTMQAILSDKNGRVLIIEPGIGYRVEENKYSIVTNYSILQPESTKDYINENDNRYELGKTYLEKSNKNFSIKDGLNLLKNISVNEGWATRVSFVYSKNKNTVYYVENNKFQEILKHEFLNK